MMGKLSPPNSVVTDGVDLFTLFGRTTTSEESAATAPGCAALAFDRLMFPTILTSAARRQIGKNVTATVQLALLRVSIAAGSKH